MRQDAHGGPGVLRQALQRDHLQQGGRRPVQLHIRQASDRLHILYIQHYVRSGTMFHLTLSLLCSMLSLTYQLFKLSLKHLLRDLGCGYYEIYCISWIRWTASQNRIWKKSCILIEIHRQQQPLAGGEHLIWGLIIGPRRADICHGKPITVGGGLLSSYVAQHTANCIGYVNCWPCCFGIEKETAQLVLGQCEKIRRVLKGGSTFWNAYWCSQRKNSCCRQLHQESGP